MDVKNYFQRVSEKVDNMTDKEFIEFLVESGLEECPLKEEFKGHYRLKDNSGLKQKINYYCPNSSESALIFKVAS